MRLIARFFLLVLGLLVAVPFGAAVLMIGVVVEPAAREILGALGLASLDAVMADLLGGSAPDATAVALLVGLWTGLFALLIAPPAFVALVGEVAGLRSFVWYGGATAAITALLPWLIRGRFDIADAALRGEGRLTALLFLTGAVTGLVYWLVAGRSAGHGPRALPQTGQPTASAPSGS